MIGYRLNARCSANIMIYTLTSLLSHCIEGSDPITAVVEGLLAISILSIITSYLL